MKPPPSLRNPIEAVLRVTSDLRDPNGGCPWDLEQDHKSLIKHLIEETYEVVDSLEALTEQDASTYHSLKEELGDLLFQIVLHSQLAQEKKHFNFDEVSLSIANKLIFRHPHVYGDLSGSELTAEDVLQNWEVLKKEERSKHMDQSKKKKTMLSNIPKSMPALLKAYRLGQKVGRIGFDWESLDRIKEEIDKLKKDIRSLEKSNEDNADLIEKEFGDILFTLCQYARHLKIDPERALQRSNERFIRRFNRVEELAEEELKLKKKLPARDWEKYWQQVKQEEK